MDNLCGLQQMPKCLEHIQLHAKGGGVVGRVMMVHVADVRVMICTFSKLMHVTWLARLGSVGGGINEA